MGNMPKIRLEKTNNSFTQNNYSQNRPGNNKTEPITFIDLHEELLKKAEDYNKGSYVEKSINFYPSFYEGSQFLSDFFGSSGSSQTSTFGLNQAAIEWDCLYYYNGNSYYYDQIKPIVNEMKKNGQPLPNITVSKGANYLYLENKLIKMGYSQNDAEIILNSIDEVGACTYASVVNAIFYQFSGDPELFKQTFGYDMYTYVNGEKYLNSQELFLDLYLYANDVKNGGFLFENNKINSNYLSSEIDHLGRNTIDANHQRFMNYYSSGVSIDILNNFIDSKNKNINFFTENVTISNSFLDSIRDFFGNSDPYAKFEKMLVDNFREGNSMIVGVHTAFDNQVTLKSCNPNFYDDFNFEKGFSHSMTVTGITDDGKSLKVSSWGQEYTISFEDLYQASDVSLDSLKMTLSY